MMDLAASSTIHQGGDDHVWNSDQYRNYQEHMSLKRGESSTTIATAWGWGAGWTAWSGVEMIIWEVYGAEVNGMGLIGYEWKVCDKKDRAGREVDMCSGIVRDTGAIRWSSWISWESADGIVGGEAGVSPLNRGLWSKGEVRRLGSVSSSSSGFKMRK